ncbi:hypothetical protein [Aureimonas sp. AU20]|uniref:hypothetical protein n=1 Tax=Aureimonas sp. AU20 TaxID=1349819 RepID=UPI00071EFE11|nr:hypothetical protein [Aureimonas sp. AU20]ALN75340.1 hypothetical protein M673_21630 [Aureimonas sp. AU20]
MRQNTELLMVALELRLMAHHVGGHQIGRRSAQAPEPLRDRLTQAAEALEALVRSGAPALETPTLDGAAPAG